MDVMDVAAAVATARDARATGAWGEAHAVLAPLAGELDADGLEQLATAAYMLGRDDEFVAALEGAVRAHERSDRAARCAFWIGLSLALRGEPARAGGWFARAGRLVERHGSDCVERGYLLLPQVIERQIAGDRRGADAAAAAAIVIAERFGDADLLALALHEQGHARVALGRVEDGLRCVDEAMVAVCAGELSPIVTGLVYCSAIDGCHVNHELGRAQEWTAALARWCDAQPDMVAFTGRCLVHRSELLQLHGAWDEALAEAQRAARRAAHPSGAGAAAEAAYREGEIARLRGDHAGAEAAYLRAGHAGSEPQPGLALLRLAQGRTEAAAAAIERALAGTRDPQRRAGLLPAAVEIALAAGDDAAARAACAELEAIAAPYRRELLDARVAHARGTLALAGGDAAAALADLRDAQQRWRALEAPYEVARSRELLGLACRALGDDEAARLELDAARAEFARLGAAPDRMRAETALGRDPLGLSARELEVLRRVAAGDTNRAIAAALVLSDRTVDRHVSNIFAKLGVSTRAAATARAYERGLV